MAPAAPPTLRHKLLGGALTHTRDDAGQMKTKLGAHQRTIGVQKMNETTPVKMRKTSTLVTVLPKDRTAYASIPLNVDHH